MKTYLIVPIVAFLTFVWETAGAQTRTWSIESEPSNERPATLVHNEVHRGWACYSSRTGGLQTNCPVTFELKGIGGPGVVLACTPDANGAISRLTCGNGGHTHGELDRPLVFPGTEVRYPGDTNNLPLVVEGPSPATFDGFRWTVPQASGYYEFESTMTAPPGQFFISFGGGVLSLHSTMVAQGRLNVSAERDTLTQLPDAPTFYLKSRNPDSDHVDSVAYSSQLATKIALTAIGRVFNINTGDVISYNDISLPKGGVFDIGSTRWSRPHSLHRRGLNVDVNKPGGVGCDVNTSVQKAVDTILGPDPTRNNQTALICERGNQNRYHINVTSLKIPQTIQTILP